MGRIHYKEEQIIAKLRKAELLFEEGKTKEQVCKALEVTPITFTRWKNKYGSMNKSEAKRLKDLEKENPRLKRIVIPILKIFLKRDISRLAFMEKT